MLSGNLRCRSLEPLTLPIQARLAFPYALKWVFDADSETSQSPDLEFDIVTVHKWIQAAVVSAGR